MLQAARLKSISSPDVQSTSRGETSVAATKGFAFVDRPGNQLTMIVVPLRSPSNPPSVRNADPSGFLLANGFLRLDPHLVKYEAYFLSTNNVQLAPGRPDKPSNSGIVPLQPFRNCSIPDRPRVYLRVGSLPQQPRFKAANLQPLAPSPFLFLPLWCSQLQKWARSRQSTNNSTTIRPFLLSPLNTLTLHHSLQNPWPTWSLRYRERGSESPRPMGKDAF